MVRMQARFARIRTTRCQTRIRLFLRPYAGIFEAIEKPCLLAKDNKTKTDAGRLLKFEGFHLNNADT